MSDIVARAMHRHLVEALERRAAGQDGEVRRILDERLSVWRATCSEEPVQPIVAAAPTRSALGGLVEHLAGGAVAEGEAAMPSSYPELTLLDDFRKAWSLLRTQSQMRQSLEQAPENAGPLNSSALVHRSIALMRELSPGYLQHFVSYVDDLSWMEQLQAGNAREPQQAASIGKRARAKPRARRE